MKKIQRNKEVIVEIDNVSDHDGCAAIYLPDKHNIVALASERVGSRVKHDEDSKISYEYLKNLLQKKGYIFQTDRDKFDPISQFKQPIHHHLAHAASAFYPSGFVSAGVLVVDGFGMYKDNLYNSTTIWNGNETKLTPLFMNAEPEYQTQSLGHLYSGVTYFLGLGTLESGKTMGLAPYGMESHIYHWMKQYISSNSDGTYVIRRSFIRAIRHISGGSKLSKITKPTNEMNETMKDITNVLGQKRKKDDLISERDKNLAWAAQTILEEIMLGLAKRTKELTKSKYLCMAGGVALNSVVNGKIIESGLFKDVFIQPASGDDGQALGKLLFRLHNEYKIKRFYVMKTASLGPKYSNNDITFALEKYKKIITFKKVGRQELLKKTAKFLASKKLVAWFQEGSEIGPRALGHRSILADPRSDWMRDYINFDVKHREWFRPLAPSVLAEKADEYFVMKAPSPFMLIVSKVKSDKQVIIPAVTHIDGTARVQTITKENNGIYYYLVKEFESQTGIPLVLNTSFNNAGEPIIETPEDAIKAFIAMKIDLLVVDRYMIKKK